MSLRFALIGLAVVLAAGVSIYLGLQAGAPASKTGAAPVVAASKVKAKTAPTPNLSRDSFKGAPAPFPAIESPAGAPAANPAPSTAPGPAMPATVREAEVARLLTSLKQVDTLPDGPEKLKRRGELVAEFAKLDPLQALAYVDTLNGDEHAQQKANALGVWAASDPNAAAAYFKDKTVAGAPATDEDRSSAAAIAKSWAERDTNAAWSWVDSLPQDARAGARAAVVSQMAANDPQAALHAVVTLTDDAERAAAMQPLAAGWAQSAPIVAAAWVSGLKDASEQASAASGLITGWMTTSPREASRWVSQLPAGDTRDSSVVAMVQAPNSMKNPESTLIWANSIQDPQLRAQILPQIFQRWQTQDPAAAQAFLVKHRPAP